MPFTITCLELAEHVCLFLKLHADMYAQKMGMLSHLENENTSNKNSWPNTSSTPSSNLQSSHKAHQVFVNFLVITGARIALCETRQWCTADLTH